MENEFRPTGMDESTFAPGDKVIIDRVGLRRECTVKAGPDGYRKYAVLDQYNVLWLELECNLRLGS